MARPFMDTLRELRNGRTHDELTDALAQLVAAVQATGRSGELKRVLDFERRQLRASISAKLGEDLPIYAGWV